MGTGNDEALAAFLMGRKKLYRISCRRPEEALSKAELEEPWKFPEAYVASTSIENAALKAIQYFNKKHGVDDHNATSVSEYASPESDNSVFID